MQLEAPDVSIAVEISFNGLDFSSQGVLFYFYDDPIVTRVLPPRGPSSGGTKVHVQGTNFYQSDLLECNFGGLRVSAEWISRTDILCTSPAINFVPEVQVVELSSAEPTFAEQVVYLTASSQSSGSFRLGLLNEISDPISHDASSLELKERLCDLTPIVNVSVSKATNYIDDVRSWTITFTSGPFSVSTLQVYAADLRGEDVTVYAESIREASHRGIDLQTEKIVMMQRLAASTVQRLEISASPVEFSRMNIDFRTSSSATSNLRLTEALSGRIADLSSSAKEADVQEALEMLVGSVGTVKISRDRSMLPSQPHGYVWSITFLALSSCPDISATDLTGVLNPIIEKFDASEPLGGVFTLEVLGRTTGALRFDASAAEVERELNAATNTNNVVVEKLVSAHNQASSWRVIFPDTLGNVSKMTLNRTQLLGTLVSHSVTVEEVGHYTTSVSFMMTVLNLGSSSYLPFNASALDVEHAIERLGGSMGLDVFVVKEEITNASHTGFAWNIEFPPSWTVGFGTHSIRASLSDTSRGVTLASEVVKLGSYSPLGGNFGLSLDFDEDESILVEWNASENDMMVALSTLNSVREVEVTRSLILESDEFEPRVGFSWSVTFISFGDFRQESGVPMLNPSYSSSNLTGNSVEVIVDTIQDGLGPAVPLEVGINGQQYSTSHVLFHYHASILLDGIYPAQGPILGGTLIVINLAKDTSNSSNTLVLHLDESDAYGKAYGSLSCKFNESIVPATVLDKYSLSCVSPPHVAGNVDVKVSLNGVDFSRSLVSFQYQHAPRKLEITPLSGPIVGGTPVTIRGIFIGGSEMMEAVKCSFGGSIVSAFSVSPHEIKCRSPPMTSPRRVTLEISSNSALDFTQEGLQYRYEPLLHVAHVQPQVGPATGNTLVTVHGGPFVNESQFMKCRFGNQVVPAYFIDLSTLQCKSPALRPIREVQRLSVRSTVALSSVLPGNFKLAAGDHCVDIASGIKCSPKYTDSLQWKASAGLVKSALQKLSSVGKVRVNKSVELTEANWYITFMSDAASGNVGQMEIVNSTLPNSYSLRQAALLLKLL